MSVKPNQPAAKDLHFHKSYKAESTFHLNDEDDEDFHIEGPLAFYEKPFTNSSWSHFMVSLLFMTTLFLLHLGAGRLEDGVTINQIFNDFSLFLALLNGVGLFLLYSATQKLRSFFTEIIRFSEPKNQASEDFFRTLYEKEFLGNGIWVFAISFGTANTIAGYLFGIPYFENKQYILGGSFLLQAFLIGCIGGITVHGLRVVLKSIRHFSVDLRKRLDYFYPDQCAGTLIIGNILFKFAIHFAIIGLLIFVFIHRFQWLNEESSHLVKLFIVIWKILPFVLSGLIFFVPAQKINFILRRYKYQEQRLIRKKMNEIAQLIIKKHPAENDASAIDNLDSHYQKLKQIDETIGQMNTWPYNLQYRAIFLSVFLPGAIGVIIETSLGLLLKALHIK
ncbi:MAG: hypothetical protein EOO53_21085 [Gammaproteobacteria bacterium]|nr:MAG: hypothetical protein EOO53_21085 [Gammaproteobacteria bacterium]